MSDEREEILKVARDAELDGRSAEAAKLRAKAGPSPFAEAPLEELLGKTMLSVTQSGNEAIDFVAVTGERWQMSYEPDCCAQCSIEDVIGDLQDLVGIPIAMAEESANKDNSKPDEGESFTWTFYKFATVKGYVTIRWYGSSNGYYSETATFRRISP